MEVDSHQVINDINVGNQSSGMERHLITKIRALLHQDIMLGFNTFIGKSTCVLTL